MLLLNIAAFYAKKAATKRDLTRVDQNTQHVGHFSNKILSIDTQIQPQAEREASQAQLSRKPHSFRLSGGPQKLKLSRKPHSFRFSGRPQKLNLSRKPHSFRLSGRPQRLNLSRKPHSFRLSAYPSLLRVTPWEKFRLNCS